MTLEERKEKSQFHHNLVELLTRDVKNDDELFNRLLWALERISLELSRFEE